MLMIATVLRARPFNLLVRDHATWRNVVVHTPTAQRFFPGDLVRIWYSGAMTQSLPPQITAIRIQRVCPGNQC